MIIMMRLSLSRLSGGSILKRTNIATKTNLSIKISILNRSYPVAHRRATYIYPNYMHLLDRFENKYFLFRHTIIPNPSTVELLYTYV